MQAAAGQTPLRPAVRQQAAALAAPPRPAVLPRWPSAELPAIAARSSPARATLSLTLRERDAKPCMDARMRANGVPRAAHRHVTMVTHTLQAPPHAMDSALRCQLHVWPAHQKEATQQRCPGLRRGAPRKGAWARLRDGLRGQLAGEDGALHAGQVALLREVACAPGGNARQRRCACSSSALQRIESPPAQYVGRSTGLTAEVSPSLATPHAV